MNLQPEMEKVGVFVCNEYQKLFDSKQWDSSFGFKAEADHWPPRNKRIVGKTIFNVAVANGFKYEHLPINFIGKQCINYVRKHPELIDMVML